MKHPLSYWQKLYRETLCFFFGHRWKFSPLRRTKWYGLSDDQVPYAVRKVTGNHYFEYVAWWRGKCTRCRYRSRVDEGDPLDPWYFRHYYGMKFGIGHFWWDLTYYNRYDITRLPYYWDWLTLLAGLAGGLQYYIMHISVDGRTPWAWWTPLADLEYWCYCMMEKYEIKK